MDKLSFVGILVGVGSILLGQWLEGGSVFVLFQEAAFIIVIGGTLGAVMLQYPFHIVVAGIKMGGWVFVRRPISPEKMVLQISAWSNVARKDGILALEPHIARIQDRHVKKGLQLLVDGNSAQKIREVLDVDNETYERFHFTSARIWESAAGYSPTIGILGAVLGLVQIMQNLSDPSKLGAGIAVAFISTIYGVGLANVVCLPISGKLKMLIMEKMLVREILADGLEAIASGENPRFIENKLQGYLY